MSQELQTHLKRAWLNVCRGESHFPRGMLFLNKDLKGRRFVAKSFDYLFNTSFQLIGKKHIYCSVYCDECIRRGIVDRIYLDLDCSKDLDKAYEDKKKVENEFSCQTNFTGFGGFALYIGVSAIRLEHPREAIRVFVEELDRELGLETLDWHVVGDLQRVSRLVFTVNLKNDKLCIPISTEWSLDYILQQSEKCSEFLPVLFRPSALARHQLEGCDRNIKPEDFEFEMPSLDEQEQYQAEVKQLLEIAPNIQDGRHTLLFSGIVPRMVLSDASDEEIINTCHEFINRTPDTPDKGSWERDYKGYVIRDIIHTRKRIERGERLKMSFTTILMERPELIPFFSIDRK